MRTLPPANAFAGRRNDPLYLYRCRRDQTFRRQRKKRSPENGDVCAACLFQNLFSLFLGVFLLESWSQRPSLFSLVGHCVHYRSEAPLAQVPLSLVTLHLLQQNSAHPESCNSLDFGPAPVRFAFQSSPQAVFEPRSEPFWTTLKCRFSSQNAGKFAISSAAAPGCHETFLKRSCCP